MSRINFISVGDVSLHGGTEKDITDRAMKVLGPVTFARALIRPLRVELGMRSMPFGYWTTARSGSARLCQSERKVQREAKYGRHLAKAKVDKPKRRLIFIVALRTKSERRATKRVATKTASKRKGVRK